jgi:hypothetical protein
MPITKVEGENRGDSAGKEEREEAIKELRARKAPLGFPIIVVDGERLIVGFRVNELREALGL